MKQLILAAVLMVALYSNTNAQGTWQIDRVTSDSLTQFFPRFDQDGGLWWWQENPISPNPNYSGYIVRDGVIAPLAGNGQVGYWDWVVSGNNVAYVALDQTTVPEGLVLYKNGLPLVHGLSDATDGIPGYRSFQGLAFSDGGQFAGVARYGLGSGYITLGPPDRMDLVSDDGTTTTLCQFYSAPACDGIFGTEVPYQVLGMMGGEWWYWTKDWLTDEWSFVSEFGQTIPQPPMWAYQAKILAGQLLVSTYEDTGSGSATSRLYRYNLGSGAYELWSDPDDFVSDYYWAFDGNAFAYGASSGPTSETIKVRSGGVDLPPIQTDLLAGLDVRDNTVVWASWGEQGGYGEIYRATWQPASAVGDSWPLYE